VKEAAPRFHRGYYVEWGMKDCDLARFISETTEDRIILQYLRNANHPRPADIEEL